MQTTQAEPEVVNAGRSSRRNFLAGAGALGIGATFAACGGSETSTATTVGGVNETAGPKKKLIWALAAIAPWNLPVDVGFHDATRILGWDYEKVGVPIDQYSPESVVNVIDRATQARPDVLVTPAWVPGVAGAAKRALDAGITVFFNDSNNIKPQTKELGIPYVGGDDYATGYQQGTLTHEAMSAGGRRDGTVIGGLAYPGNDNLEDRIRGAFDAIQDLNDRAGTDFVTERFIDGTARGNGPGRIQYAAKARQVGREDLAGVITISDVSAPVGALKELGYDKGDVVVTTFGLMPTTISAIEDGWVAGSVDYQSYTHGFVTTMLAWQRVNRGQPAHQYLNDGGNGAIVTKDNVAEFAEREKLIQDLGTQYGVKLS